MRKLKIVFFTGAGISAESGLATFRDSENGLWNNFRIEDVCSPLGWYNNPRLVLDFYNERRRQCLSVRPNKAHDLIAALESDFEVTVITQNVDDLHERAGSTNIIHLHGELFKTRSTIDANLIYTATNNTNIGDCCELGSQLRPYIVWFGEMLDEMLLKSAILSVLTCDVCVIIGTSLQVYPANTIPCYVQDRSKLIIIDSNSLMDSIEFDRDFHFIQKSAVEGMELIYQSLLKKMN
jgi:NAD-dependent deacetylase